MWPSAARNDVYELMRQNWSRNIPCPMPWWLQSYLWDLPGDGRELQRHVDGAGIERAVPLLEQWRVKDVPGGFCGTSQERSSRSDVGTGGAAASGD